MHWIACLTACAWAPVGFFKLLLILLFYIRGIPEAPKIEQKIDVLSIVTMLTVDLQSLSFPAKTWHPVLKYRLHDGKGGDDKIVSIA